MMRQVVRRERLPGRLLLQDVRSRGRLLLPLSSRRQGATSKSLRSPRLLSASYIFLIPPPSSRSDAPELPSVRSFNYLRRFRCQHPVQRCRGLARSLSRRVNCASCNFHARQGFSVSSGSTGCGDLYICSFSGFEPRADECMIRLLVRRSRRKECRSMPRVAD